MRKYFVTFGGLAFYNLEREKDDLKRANLADRLRKSEVFVYLNIEVYSFLSCIY